MEIKEILYDVEIEGENYQFNSDHLLDGNEFDNKIHEIICGKEKYYVSNIEVFIFYKDREIENDWGEKK